MEMRKKVSKNLGGAVTKRDADIGESARKQKESAQPLPRFLVALLRGHLFGS